MNYISAVTITQNLKDFRKIKLYQLYNAQNSKKYHSILFSGKLIGIDFRGNNMRFYIQDPEGKFYKRICKNKNDDQNDKVHCKAIPQSIKLSGIIRVNWRLKNIDKRIIATQYPIGAYITTRARLFKGQQCLQPMNLMDFAEDGKENRNNSLHLQKRLDNDEQVVIAQSPRALEQQMREDEMTFKKNRFLIEQKDQNNQKKLRYNKKFASKQQDSLYSEQFRKMPDFEDLQRIYFFKRIILRGYAVAKPQLSVCVYDRERNLFDAVEQYRIIIASRISSAFRANTDVSGLMIAFLLGDISFIPEKIYSLFLNSGSVHLIAISGMHIAALSMLAFFLVRWLCFFLSSFLEFIPAQKIASTLSVAVISAYFLLSGMSLSALRALICSLLFAYCILADRSSSFLRILNSCALLILLARPEELFSPSLQLSLISCCGIICGVKIQPQIQKLLLVSKRRESFFDAVRNMQIAANQSIKISDIQARKTEFHCKYDISNFKYNFSNFNLKRFSFISNKVLNRMQIALYILKHFPSYCGRFAQYCLAMFFTYFFSLSIISTVIACFTFAITLWHFSTFSLYSVPTNLILVPICDLIVMPLAIAALLKILFMGADNYQFALGATTFDDSLLVSMTQRSMEMMIDIARFFGTQNGSLFFLHVGVDTFVNTIMIAMMVLVFICTVSKTSKVLLYSLAFIIVLIILIFCFYL